MNKHVILLLLILLTALFANSQPNSGWIIKTSLVDMALGDRTTTSWSPNIVFETLEKTKISFQIEAGPILMNKHADKFFIDIYKIFGVRINPSVKRYLGKTCNSNQGFNLAIDCNTVVTNATVKYSGAVVKRLVVAPHLNIGYQSISKRNFVFEVCAGLGPGFVASSSSIDKANLGVLTYSRGILYEGGSGVYLSYHFDVKLGYHISHKP